ncbi:hypothetical protein TNCT_378161 [Trichonephila clavata]|uniref:Uncharacterized protein n=1 Tax=Trichonephila clavata TaxID=2740835 RepID=A0A8X6GFM2_TRICU|nr:hypothetical protein TNCT_378161 [Trichonephila clavata]
MSSIDQGSWSDRTDATSPSATGLGANCDSPSRKSFGDDFIVENSDVFREAIKARNVYAAWARKLTQAKPLILISKISPASWEVRSLNRQRQRRTERRNRFRRPPPPLHLPALSEEKAEERMSKASSLPPQLVRKKRTTSALPSTSQSGETEVIESAPTPSTSTARQPMEREWRLMLMIPRWGHY